MGSLRDIHLVPRFAGERTSQSRSRRRGRNARGSRATFAAVLCLGVAPVSAFGQTANTGAGGDPRTSVAQPEVSGKPSAVATTSIQATLGDAADPTGLRRFLSDRGISSA